MGKLGLGHGSSSENAYRMFLVYGNNLERAFHVECDITMVLTAPTKYRAGERAERFLPDRANVSHCMMTEHALTLMVVGGCVCR